MNQKQQINIDPNTLKDIPCECGSLLFTQVIRLKYISALQSPDGKNGVVRMVGVVCVECGKTDGDAMNFFDKKQKEEFDSKVVHIGKKPQNNDDKEVS